MKTILRVFYDKYTHQTVSPQIWSVTTRTDSEVARTNSKVDQTNADPIEIESDGRHTQIIPIKEYKNALCERDRFIRKNSGKQMYACIIC